MSVYSYLSIAQSVRSSGTTSEVSSWCEEGGQEEEVKVCMCLAHICDPVRTWGVMFQAYTDYSLERDFVIDPSL